MLFDRLSGREKVLVLAMVGALLVFLGVMISIFVNIALDGLKDRVATKRDNHAQILSLKSRFDKAKVDIEKIKKEITENEDVKITQVIGTLAEENGISITQTSQAKGAIDKKSKIREISYKVELRKVELAPLMRMLEGVEAASRLLFVRNLSLRRRYNNKSEIDVTFYVSTIVPYEPEG